uniref:Uncharacterized protein n=1 Tax=Panagrolaimus sp. JU765 TaxID=591449 RepID=A0AC34RMS7_9BILA
MAIMDYDRLLTILGYHSKISESAPIIGGINVPDQVIYTLDEEKTPLESDEETPEKPYEETKNKQHEQ